MLSSHPGRWFDWPGGPLDQEIQVCCDPEATTMAVQLQADQPARIAIPTEGLSMGKRLEALLRFCAGASRMLGRRFPAGRFFVQLRDEAPLQDCFRFDAPLHWDGGGPLIPDPYCLMGWGYADFRHQLVHQPLPPWHGRLPMALWRGSSTGTARLTPASLATNLRYQLCRHSLSHPALIDARLTAVVQAPDASHTLRLRHHLEQEGLWSERISPWHAALHRWLIEIDGNVNSWGLLWKLLSGSCVVRVGSARRQWYHHRLKAWDHFIPVAPDLSDLIDQLAWCQSHPQECAAIAAAGQSLALTVVEDLEQDLLTATTTYAQRWMEPTR
jgi:hypothetical protein